MIRKKIIFENFHILENNIISVKLAKVLLGYVTTDQIYWMMAHSSALCFLLALCTFFGCILHLIYQTMDIFSMDLTFNRFINNFILENKATKKCPLKPTLLEQYNGWISSLMHNMRYIYPVCRPHFLSFNLPYRL